MSKIYITSEGYKKICDKLQELKNLMPEIRKSLQVAREFGDFSENAELDAAKERERYISTEISRLESLIPKLVIPEYKDHRPYVRFGAYIKLKNDTKELHYRIVGSEEADITQNTISMQAPIAQAALAKQIGDIISVITPEGVQKWTIINVEYHK